SPSTALFDVRILSARCRGVYEAGDANFSRAAGSVVAGRAGVAGAARRRGASAPPRPPAPGGAAAAGWGAPARRRAGSTAARAAALVRRRIQRLTGRTRQREARPALTAKLLRVGILVLALRTLHNIGNS